MKKTIWYYLTLILMSVCISSGALADNAASSFQEAFQKGKFSGSLRSYYFSQTFEGAGKNDSGIWVNGGNLKYETASLYGLSLGANFQASTVTDKDDDDRRNAGDLDADGAFLFLEIHLPPRFRGFPDETIGIDELRVNDIRPQTFAHDSEREVCNVFHRCEDNGSLYINTSNSQCSPLL